MLKNKNTKNETRAYVRVSTLKESQKDSPEHQEGLIRENAATEGVTIHKVYLDRGTATNIIEREDVQQMVEDAKNGEFNTIYFASLSRFSRDTLDAISLKRILVNALGIRLVSIEDMYDSSKEDNEMIFTIISSVNQKQSETTSTSVKRGIRQSAKKGNFTGSIAPFGYKKVNIDGRKALEIVPEEAKIVREIFELYANKNMGEKAVTNYLNDVLELPSPKGGIWGLSSVQRILQNENYTGYLTFCKLETQKVYEDLNDMQNRRKKLVQRDNSLWEKTDFQTHEAIIPPELFEKAQKMRGIRGGGKRGGRKDFVNVFAKMIFCKECGTAMVTMSSEKKLSKTDDPKRYRYLMCSKRRRQGEKGCSNSTWIPYEETRDQIISGVIERLNRKINLESFMDEASDTSDYANRDFDKDIKRLEKTISDNRRLLFEIRRQNMLGEIETSQYDFEKEQYEGEIADAERKIKSLSKTADEHKNREQLKADIQHTLSYLSAMESYDEVDKTRMNLLRLIEKIEVNQEGEVDVYSVLGQL